ncbi:hypothetical protein FRB99_004860 [Tulasnella sp. 403]|nr:hypothetical protein FRB99_004860 [Tulasnella sp. 403]
MPGAPAAAQSKTTPNAKAGPSRPTKGTITPKPPPKKPYECLRDWRKPGKTTSISNSKLCPMCRAPSRYITPSSLFFKEGDPRKTKAIETYKASMGKVSCKYFERSLPGRRSCPYGDDCFYKHEEEEGKRYMFNHGVDQMMDVFKNELRRQPRRRRRMIIYDDYDDLDFDGFSDGPDPLDDWSTHAGLHIEPDNEWLPTETGIQWGTSPTGWDWSVATWGTVSAWGTLAD